MAQATTAPPAHGSWWDRMVMKEADRDRMGMGERIGNIIGMFFIVFVALIFIDIQLNDYGFFTSSFGPVEQVAFYAPLLYGLVPSLVKAATGRRNLGRLFDLIGSVLFIIAGSYLLIVFPFDFTQLLDILPAGIRPSWDWFNNDLFKALLTIGLVIGAISTVYNAILYVSVRGELRDRAAGAAGTAGPAS